MFNYYTDLALRSLNRNPVLTGLMIAAIAFGISACMTTLTVFSPCPTDPIPAQVTPAVRTSNPKLGDPTEMKPW